MSTENDKKSATSRASKKNVVKTSSKITTSAAKNNVTKSTKLKTTTRRKKMSSLKEEEQMEKNIEETSSNTDIPAIDMPAVDNLILPTIKEAKELPELVTLNEYLYEYHTVPRIIELFSDDLRTKAISTGNAVDLQMSSFFLDYSRLLLNSVGITDQSNRLQGFYQSIVYSHREYSFAFAGRLKSLYRTYLKYNRYIKTFVEDYHNSTGDFPNADQINDYIAGRFRDLCGYKFVVGIPPCRIEGNMSIEEKKKIADKRSEEIVYKIANILPSFLQQNRFTILEASSLTDVKNPVNTIYLKKEVCKYYKDYISSPNARNYMALHLSCYDPTCGSNLEIQLVTDGQDAYNRLYANHALYENDQAKSSKNVVAECYNNCKYYKDAVDRTEKAYDIKFSKVHINMFSARSKTDYADKAGFLEARQITPFEHLSEKQVDNLLISI